MQTPTLDARRIRLESFTEDDVGDRYLGWLNDAEVNRFLEVRHDRQTRAMALEFVRSFAGPTERHMWAVRAGDGGPLIGTATMHTINRRHGTAELGIMIGERAYWGGTTALDVLSLMIEFAFGSGELRRLTAGTYARHWGMNLLYKRLGFALEGTLRLAYRLDDEYVDGYRWGLLASDWTRPPRG